MTDKEQHSRLLPFAFLRTIEKAVEQFSFAEKIILYALASIMVVSATIILFRTNDLFLVEVPTHGGSLTEGIIGTPRFVNPLLAISDADRDLTELVYSGLLKAQPDGTLVPDLAQSYSVSDDGLTYTFILKDGLTFHDGTPITADDVEFTVQKAEDPIMKSPKRANWDSVLIEKVSSREIHFVLKQPYAPFLENATIGILPKHIWKDLSAEEFPLSYVNIEPVGSGPFKVSNIKRSSSGIPTEYELKSFNHYALGEPYLDRLTIAFYPSEESLLAAFKNGSVESVNSITPEQVPSLPEQYSNTITTPLSRIFAVFFDQNENAVFADPYVRRALDVSVDKDAIVHDVLSGFGVATDGPVPPGFLGPETVRLAAEAAATSTASTTPLKATVASASTTTTPEIPAPVADKITAARAILERGGWEVNPTTGIFEKTDKKKKSTQTLHFTLSTSNAPELKKTAELLKQTWESLGAQVDVQVFEPGDLSQNVIRPRKYDALLFGEIIGRDLDLFAFWHSSQRNDPGLNIAFYTNTKADKLLSDARTLQDRDERLTKYQQFADIIASETPAVFLYSPTLIYIAPKTLHGIELGHVTIPSERFLSVNKWYVETEKVWKVFMNKKISA